MTRAGTEVCRSVGIQLRLDIVDIPKQPSSDGACLYD